MFFLSGLLTKRGMVDLLLSGMEVTAFPQRTEWAVVHAVAVVAREAGSFVSHGECPLGIQGFLGKNLC